MISPASIENATDSELWTLVCQGNAEAFEVILRRYQSLICAVAYSTCGELAQSEDVAQETFWTAWRGRESLDQPSKLRSWLCGIARNLGKNARRHASRPVESAANLDALAERPADAPGPVEEAISREEESLIWKTLEQIPDTFREPLILFYRENQSVAQVAFALDLSEAAVKQRLSRGRSMLREQVAEQVEGGLRRTRPGRAFTVAVMAGVTAGSSGAKTAVAAGAATKAAGPLVKAAVGGGLSAGALGALLGSLLGLGGAWLGTWVPAQLAPTTTERDVILRTGRRMLIFSVIWLGTLLLAIKAFAGGASYLIAFGILVVAFEAYVLIESIRLAQAVKRIRQNASPAAEPNPAAMRTGMNALASRYQGRVFRSRAALFGLPLIDVNVSDPGGSSGSSSQNSDGKLPRIARGWIAIGDHARGIILAIGSNTARGFFALGGRTVGVVSVGGLAVGLVAVGGLAVGVLALGGLSAGAIAVGGLGIGWQAAGGGAIAWDTAGGGLAIAHHAAFGGAGGTAYAHDYALGFQGSATHFNDEAAKAALVAHPLKLGMDWSLAHINWLRVAIFAVAFGAPVAMLPLMYRRERGG
jgi:zinc protease